MTTFQDVCSQLMKPAKELAEWDFPLAQILENYYTLLSEPCDLNFSEAALVLQNSANVYVRRVEYLYQETTALSKSMQEHEDEEQEKTKDKNHRKSRKTLIDFKNFNLVDFSNGTLKKSHEREKSTKEDRKIKLISPRFPQLENMSRHTFSQDIIDVQGEVIGKKYDFRCNQQLTVSKMLIEEVTPLDFNHNDSENSSRNIEVTALVHCDHNYNSDIDRRSDHMDDHVHNNDYINDPIVYNNDHIRNDHNYDCVGHYDHNYDLIDHDDDDDETSRDAGMLSSALESAYGSMVSSSNPNTPSSRLIDLSQTLNPCPKDSDDILMSPIADSFIESDGCPNDSGLEHSTTPVSDNVESDGAELSEKSTDKSSPADFDILLEKHSENDIEINSEKTENETVLNDASKETENTSKTRDSIEADAGYTSGDPEDLHMSLTPKRLKKPDELHESSWKPIPVESIVPDKIPRCRREFKLPCHIALLKSVPKLRKRTLNETAKKRYSKKLSLEKQAKEAKQIKKMFEEHLKNQLEIESQNYKAVVNENMDLLGYRSKDNTPLVENVEDSDTLRDKSRCSSLSEAVCSPPPSPGSPSNFSNHEQDDDFEGSGFKTLGQTYQERIERKMKELEAKFNVTRQREEASKWYEAVEALKAAECRPSFHVDEYEKRIIESLKANNEHQVEFHEIAEQEEPGNIARLFVASLHLANTYNVELNVVNKEDNSELNLKLLDAEYSHKT